MKKGPAFEKLLQNKLGFSGAERKFHDSPTVRTLYSIAQCNSNRCLQLYSDLLL